MVGETVMELVVIPPGFHTYAVDVPAALKVAVLPIHNIVGVAVTVMVGTLILTVTVLVFVHPPELPVTEYVVFTVGLTTTLDPVNVPGIQVYVVAPVAVNVDELPRHINVGEAVGVTVIPGVETITIDAVDVQPLAFLPITL